MTKYCLIDKAKIGYRRNTGQICAPTMSFDCFLCHLNRFISKILKIGNGFLQMRHDNIMLRCKIHHSLREGLHGQKIYFVLHKTIFVLCKTIGRRSKMIRRQKKDLALIIQDTFQRQRELWKRGCNNQWMPILFSFLLIIGNALPSPTCRSKLIALSNTNLYRAFAAWRYTKKVSYG